MTNEDLTPNTIEGPIAEVALLIFRAIGTLLSGTSAAASGDVALIQQKALADARPTLLTATEAAEALRRGAMTEAEWHNTLNRSGFSDRAQQVLTALTYALLGAGELVEMRKRGDLDAHAYRERMAQQGYTEDDAERLYRLGEYVPPAQDVITFAVREVYTPEIAERFGQYEDFPTQALPDFQRAGVPEEQARKYWAAHWGLPPVNLVMEMYHRRAETGVTLEDVRALLRAQDVMPYWRDRIVQVATSPYTRVDVRRMHKLGILDLAAVERAYQELGYSDERAHNLALFTEAVNEGEDEDAIEPFRAGLRGRALTMYQNGTLPQSDLIEMLANLGYSDEQVTAYITEAEFIRAADRADAVRSNIKKLYVAGFWTVDTATERLARDGFARDEIVDLIAEWDVAREFRDESDAERAEKDLTKTEVIGAYTDGIMKQGDAEQALSALGYDAAEVDIYLRRADLANAKKARAEMEAATKGAYLAGRLDEADARSQLAKGGIEAARVTALLDGWKVERASRMPTLTLAQVQAAYKKNLLTREQATKRIDEMGYNNEDREVLLALAQ